MAVPFIPSEEMLSSCIFFYFLKHVYLYFLWLWCAAQMNYDAGARPHLCDK